MTGKFKAVLTALAVVVLAAGLLVPIAGVSGHTPGGTVDSPSPWPRMMLTPTYSSTIAPGRGDSWCGGGTWGGFGW